jgi:hypothetical protein
VVRAVKGDAGGIGSLCNFLKDEEVAGAVNADLLERGRNLDMLGTAGLSWWDLKCLIKWARQDSALSRLQNEDWRWDLNAQLLASVTDELARVRWKALGQKKSDWPKPVPRPGVESNKVIRHRTKRTYTTAEIDARLGLNFNRQAIGGG